MVGHVETYSGLPHMCTLCNHRRVHAHNCSTTQASYTTDQQQQVFNDMRASGSADSKRQAELLAYGQAVEAKATCPDVPTPGMGM